MHPSAVGRRLEVLTNRRGLDLGAHARVNLLRADLLRTEDKNALVADGEDDELVALGEGDASQRRL